MWVVCDSSDCYHFSSDDNGHLYRASTSLSSFPKNMGQPVIALTADKYDAFEASNVYWTGSKYLLIIEAIGSDGHRYFRSWTSPSLSGSWTLLAGTMAAPFLGSQAVTSASSTLWTKDFSHGEVVRTNPDQTMTIDACTMQYLYQGVQPGSSGDYNAIPWRLALATLTSKC